MWDERVNGTIDEVAREMTARKPPDLRGAVIARITGAEVRRSPFGARRWVMVPLAAAVAVAIAVFVARAPVPRPPSQRESETVADRATPTAPPIVAQETAKAAVPRASARLAFAEEADRPTEQVESIAIAPLAVDALRPDPILIERLDTPTSMTVAPLDITDPQKERDR